MSRECIDPRADRDLELALYAGGDLPDGAALRVEAHLTECSACRELLRELEGSREALAGLAAEPVEAEALARVRRAVRRRIDAEAVRKPERRAWALALAASLLLAVLGAAVWLRAVERGRARAADPPERVAAAPRLAPPGPSAATEAPVLRSDVADPEARAPATTPSREPLREPAPRAAARPSGSIQRAAARPPAPTEAIVIQVVSNDPDIVFYWLVEPEETRDETHSS